MKRKSCWCLGMACMLAILIGSQPVQARDYHKLLVVGNSITEHGPNSAIFWSGAWGMAASSLSTDFAHRLHTKLQATQPGIAIELQIGHIGSESTMTGYDHLTSTGADLIVIELGDNYTGALTYEALQVPFENMIAGIKAGGNAPDVFVVSTWGSTVPARNNLIHQAALNQGATYVDITRYSADPMNSVTSESYCLEEWRSGTGAGVGWHPGDRGMEKIADAIFSVVPVSDVTSYNFPSEFGTNPQGQWSLQYGLDITSKTLMTNAGAAKWNSAGTRPSFAEYANEFRLRADSGDSAFLTFTCPQSGYYDLDMSIRSALQNICTYGVHTYVKVYTSAAGTNPIWSKTDTWYGKGSSITELKFYPELQQLQLAAGDVITIQFSIDDVWNYDECAFTIEASGLSSSTTPGIAFGQHVQPTHYIIPSTFSTNPQAQWQLCYGATKDTMVPMVNQGGTHWNANGQRPAFGQYGSEFRFTDMYAENNAYLVFTCPETGFYSLRYRVFTQMQYLWNYGIDTHYAVYTSTSAEAVWDYALDWPYNMGNYPLEFWYVPALQRMELNAGDKIILQLGVDDLNNYNEAVFTFDCWPVGTLPFIEFMPAAVVEEPNLVVTPGSQSVGSGAGTITFDVSNGGTGAMAWTAAVTSGGDWLSITDGTSGSNAGAITVIFTDNTSSLNDRTGTIRISAPGAAGDPVDVTVVQAKKIIPGDANLDGRVNFSDYLDFSVGFGSTGTPGTMWGQGDFNEDGVVNFSDYLLLSSNFGSGGAVSADEVAKFKAASASFEDASQAEAVQQTLPCTPLAMALMTLIGLAFYGLGSSFRNER